MCQRIDFLAGNNLADATDRSNTAGVVVIGRGLIACFADFEQPLINAVVASCCPVLAARFSRNTGELIIGIDATLGNLRGGLRRFGFAGGYQHTSLNIVDRASSGGVDTYHVAAYTGT